MKTIEITADDMLFQSLEDLARAESKSLEALAREALSQCVKGVTAKRPSYSFIGIGRSGKGAEDDALARRIDDLASEDR